MVEFTSYALNSSNPFDIFVAVNTTTNYWLAHLILIGLFLIILLPTLRWGFGKSFAASSFVTTGMAVLFVAMGVITTRAMFIAIIASVIGIVALYLDN